MLVERGEFAPERDPRIDQEPILEQLEIQFAAAHQAHDRRAAQQVVRGQLDAARNRQFAVF